MELNSASGFVTNCALDSARQTAAECCRAFCPPPGEMPRRVRTGNKTPGEAGPNYSGLEQRPDDAADVSGRSAVRTHLEHPLLLVRRPARTPSGAW